MNVLIEITSEDAADILIQLASACDRSGVTWGCFFTGRGVLSLSSKKIYKSLETAVTAISCELSWEQHMGDRSCPVQLGSQTNNSAIVGDADKVISL